MGLERGGGWELAVKRCKRVNGLSTRTGGEVVFRLWEKTGSWGGVMSWTMERIAKRSSKRIIIKGDRHDVTSHDGSYCWLGRKGRTNCYPFQKVVAFYAYIRKGVLPCPGHSSSAPVLAPPLSSASVLPLDSVRLALRHSTRVCAVVGRGMECK